MDQRIELSDRPAVKCYLASQTYSAKRNVLNALRRGIRKGGARLVSVEPGPLTKGDLRSEIAAADILVADLTDMAPNVLLEVGIAETMGKYIVLCASELTDISKLPPELLLRRWVRYIPTTQGLIDLANALSVIVRDYRQAPLRVGRSSSFNHYPPFSIEWDRLDRSETENLCHELLAQMGYQRVDWSKEAEEFDLIAELPRRDPDGFEYRELWLISMNARRSIDLMNWTSSGVRYLSHRLMRHAEQMSERLVSRYALSNPITVLFILLDDEREAVWQVAPRERIRQVRGGGGGVRIRSWDRAYLTSLVRQFPQIGYKYFSDEERARSKYRKTPEELYQENLTLAVRQRQLVGDLEAEKNRRVSAERDAVWKDISFAAAHKIGNPIFAIETDLDPLERRLRESRPSEALSVLENIRSSIEKAKAIIDQFKSLTRAQQIALENVVLRPIVEESVEIAERRGIQCKVDCSGDIVVRADPERLVECFDELVMNCTNWRRGENPKLDVTVQPAASVPSSLNADRKYAVIHFRDNGQGVPLEIKAKIFDAFFTTHEHGTGLGLALVRRIVDGHGGSIAEVGEPGGGADFEIYLPMAQALSSDAKLVMPDTDRKNTTTEA